jgi:hypothetical protein
MMNDGVGRSLRSMFVLSLLGVRGVDVVVIAIASPPDDKATTRIIIYTHLIRLSWGGRRRQGRFIRGRIVDVDMLVCPHHTTTDGARKTKESSYLENST